MFGLGYVKVDPTTHLIHLSGGKTRRSGKGLAFWYWRATSVLVAIPTASREESFLVEERSSDHQSLVLNAALTYRVAQPERLAQQLNFALGPGGQHASDDPDQLPQRVVGIAQAVLRPLLQALALREALGASEGVGQQALAALREAPGLQALGVEVQALAIHGIRPSPELGRALEAGAREALQREADAAIAARREAAVAQDRAIREAELEARRSTEARERELSEAQQAFRLAQSREDLEARLAEAGREAEAEREGEREAQASRLALAAEAEAAERKAKALAQEAELALQREEAEAKAALAAQQQAAKLARFAEEGAARRAEEAKELEATTLREAQRAELVASEAANARVRAEAAAHALATSLAPLAQLEPRALQALTAGHGDARVVMAHAFQDLALNAHKVGQLNLSPDFLSALMQGQASA